MCPQLNLGIALKMEQKIPYYNDRTRGQYRMPCKPANERHKLSDLKHQLFLDKGVVTG